MQEVSRVDGLWRRRGRKIPAMTALDTAHSARDIGKRIQAIREALGDSQADFSRRTSLSAQSISNYESGYRRIDLDQALILCDRTGATLDWVYFGDPSGLPRKFAGLGDQPSRRPA